jgi:hypothetical protein
MGVRGIYIHVDPSVLGPAKGIIARGISIKIHGICLNSGAKTYEVLTLLRTSFIAFEEDFDYVYKIEVSLDSYGDYKLSETCLITDRILLMVSQKILSTIITLGTTNDLTFVN